MCKRYNIQTKKNGVWSEWTSVDNYLRAKHHLEHVGELGYHGRLRPSKAVKKLWDILGKDQTELTDKILDEGFNLTDEAIKETLTSVKMGIRKKQVKVNGKKLVSIDDLYDVMDKILNGVGESFEE